MWNEPTERLCLAASCFRCTSTDRRTRSRNWKLTSITLLFQLRRALLLFHTTALSLPFGSIIFNYYDHSYYCCDFACST